MATINGSVSQRSDSYSFYITWSETKASDYLTTNKTTVKATAYIACTAHTAWASGLSQTLTIDGTKFTDTKTVDLSPGVTVALISGEKTITHNADGSKSITISASCELPYGNGWGPDSGSASGTAKLTTILREPKTSSQSLNSKTETTIKMNWSSDCTIKSIKYSTNGGTNWSDEVNVTDGTSGTYTISGLSANKTYSIKTRVIRKDNSLYKDSSALSVTTYNYPHCTASPNFTIGDKLTLSLYNPLKRSVSVTIIAADGSTKTTTGHADTSVFGFNNADWQKFWYKSIPSATSGKYKVKVDYGSTSTHTRNNGNTYTVDKTKCMPVFSSCEYEDYGSNSKLLTGDPKTFINGYNCLKVTIPVANKAVSPDDYGATMSKYRLVCGNQSVEATYKDNAEVSLKLDYVTNMTFVVYAIDSRGISTSVTESVATWKDYFNTTIKSASVARTNGVGTETTLTFTGEFWNKAFGDLSTSVHNKITECQYLYKKTNEPEYTIDPIPITLNTDNSNVFTFSAVIEGDTKSETIIDPDTGEEITTLPGFDATASYNIQIGVKDEIRWATYDLTLGSGTPMIAITPNGIAFGSMYDETMEGVVQLPANNYFQNGVGGAINLRNSCITRANGIWMNDEATGHEGINFLKKGGNRLNTDDYECLRGYRGNAYYGDVRLLNYYDLYYKSGDTENVNRCITGGYVTSSTTSIRFSVLLPKKMDNVTPTITSGTISVRAATGGYLLSALEITDVVTSIGKTSNVLVIYCNSDTAYNTTNNTPVSVDVSNMVLSFA